MDLDVQFLPRERQPVTPWKNGGGSTRQVAIDPPGASLATGFRWRVSSARMATNGPFSPFPGVDRSLWLLRGNGLVLAVAGSPVRLDRPLQRHDFAGETPVSATLIDGPIEDLNVMVARGTVVADARILAPTSPAAAPIDAPTLVLALHGRVHAAGHDLRADDALLVTPARPTPIGLRADDGARILLVTFRPWPAG